MDGQFFERKINDEFHESYRSKVGLFFMPYQEKKKERAMIQIDDHPEPYRTSQSLICVVGTPKVIGS